MSSQHLSKELNKLTVLVGHFVEGLKEIKLESEIEITRN